MRSVALLLALPLGLTACVADNTSPNVPQPSPGKLAKASPLLQERALVAAAGQDLDEAVWLAQAIVRHHPDCVAVSSVLSSINFVAAPGCAAHDLQVSGSFSVLPENNDLHSPWRALTFQHLSVTEANEGDTLVLDGTIGWDVDASGTRHEVAELSSTRDGMAVHTSMMWGADTVLSVDGIGGVIVTGDVANGLVLTADDTLTWKSDGTATGDGLAQFSGIEQPMGLRVDLGYQDWVGDGGFPIRQVRTSCDAGADEAVLFLTGPDAIQSVQFDDRTVEATAPVYNSGWDAWVSTAPGVGCAMSSELVVDDVDGQAWVLDEYRGTPPMFWAL